MAGHLFMLMLLKDDKMDGSTIVKDLKLELLGNTLIYTDVILSLTINS